MHKKLVPFERNHFLEVDAVRLKRKAMVLRDEIQKKVKADHDVYSFHSMTLPVVEAAIRGEITQPIAEEFPAVSANFHYDKSEGFLSAEYDRDFARAVAGFEVSVYGIPLDETNEVWVDGTSYAWAEFEDEGDWPDHVKYP